MNKKMTLDELRAKNSGYNPEPLDAHYLIFSDETETSGNIYIQRKDEYTGNQDDKKMETWVSVSISNEEEFIIIWPETYGLIHNGQIYIKESDFYK